MQIIKVTTITLEDKEITALQTLQNAHSDCVCNECYECDNCPLYHKDGCIGEYAESVLRSWREKNK